MSKKIYENVISETHRETKEFFDNGIKIAGSAHETDLKDSKLYASKDSYQFKQWDMLDLIDLYYNSQFEKGPFDSQGKRKLFLNTVRFETDVATNKTDIDIKDHVFVPEDNASIWPAYFMKKDFIFWAKKNGYAKLINELNEDRNKYGTCVIKIVKGVPHRVVLKSLRNPINARSLKIAFEAGQAIIEEHEMTYTELKNNTAWPGTQDLEPFRGKKKVYERYGLVRMNEIEAFRDNKIPVDSGDATMVKALTIILEQEKGKNQKEKGGKILFIQKTSKLPYLESHLERQDGRWLGIGRVERGLQNQIARNTITNLRRRALEWSAKKVYQGIDDTIAENILTDVQDGAILRVGPQGEIKPIDTTTRAHPDFRNMAEEWQVNQDRDGFSFEVASGENLSSGVPFRLGVLLSNAAQSFFARKQEDFAIFLKDVLFDHVVPAFIQQNQDHVVSVASSDQGFTVLRKALFESVVNEEILKRILINGTIPAFEDIEQIRLIMSSKFRARKELFFKVKQDMYKNIKATTDIVITGESKNIEKKIETYTNLLQTVAGNPNVLVDPASRAILATIMSNTGENLDEIVGDLELDLPNIPQGASPGGGRGRSPAQIVGREEKSLNELANQNAPNKQATF